MVIDIDSLNEEIKESSAHFSRLRSEIAKVIIGQRRVIDKLLVALLSNGHVLLEGLPGLAKTLTVKTLARAIASEFKRIQFTPDLLPADLLGISIYNPQMGTFSVKKGPILTNFLLADEINRAPAKVQAALLQVMQERQVTIGGETFHAGDPYMVLATQNPIEQEGTYPLPEAQTDRFMLKVTVDYPSKEEEKAIMERIGRKAPPSIEAILTTQQLATARDLVRAIYIDEKIVNYILDLIFATRNPANYGIDIEGMLLFGASPRASLAWQHAAQAHAFLDTRAYVTPHDVKSIAHEVLRHRLRRSYEAEAENISADAIIDELLAALPVP